MKLRLHQNHVRFRLGPRDLVQLRRDGELLATTAGLTYGLHLADDDRLDGPTSPLVVDLDKRRFTDWLTSTDLVHAFTSANVQVTIEKDLPCRDGRDASDDNVFHDLT